MSACTARSRGGSRASPLRSPATWPRSSPRTISWSASSRASDGPTSRRRSSSSGRRGRRRTGTRPFSGSCRGGGGAGGLIAGVLGGGLSEGGDYRDNLLRAVCIVGLPLSPPTLEVEALKAYYTAKFGGEKGHEYAGVYPALNKVLQAAGRPIRGERDRAVVVLMDRRYLDARYVAGRPPDFRYRG